MSPRRSSRARTTNPPAAPTTSSASSLSSGRAERTTRSNNKVSSPHRSGHRSQSIDDADERKPAPRRTRSGHEDLKAPNPPEDEIEDEDEEEVTRCLCGQAEYPGLVTPILDALKQQAKENGTNISADVTADDVAGIFIQCDICKVWQHGGCVGIINDESAPDDYYCEECRKDLHNVATTSSGQKYSLYLPIKQDASPTASSTPPNRDSRSGRTKDPKPRASAEALAAKRRPTMNSYDEDEQLQRAIEESKKDGVGSVDEANRRPKRSRSDSEEHKTSVKRPRTGSASSSADAEKAGVAISSSDEALAAMQKPREDSPKKIRGAAARNHREKELREQKERERQEAATRRKARSERRRGEESDVEDPPALEPPSTTSSPPAPEPPPSRSHKKKPAGKGRRTGRNQYTRDRDLPVSSLQAALDPNDTPVRTRSRSRSVARGTESPRSGVNGVGTINGHGHGVGHGKEGTGPFGGDSRPSKPKYLHLTRTSFNEMKKRVAGILEFVNRAQDENKRAASNQSSSAGDKEKDKHKHKDGAKNGVVHAEAKAEFTVNVNGAGIEADFGSLATAEMLNEIKGKLVQWEDEYGRWPRA